MYQQSISKLEIDIKNYERIKRINKGGFGTVYKVKDKKSGEFYAAKVIDCGDNQEECNKMIDREVGILMYSKHPTIIKFIGYSKLDFLEESNVTIIMELAINGSLSNVLKKIQEGNGPKDYTNTTRQIILVGISRGMKYLHDRNIIHRDLKPGNILLDDNFHPHITDFGLSKMFETGHSYSQSQVVGTLSYMAPELFKGEKYDRKADVYSFGILMYEVITDLSPYPDLETNKITDFEFRRRVMNDSYRPTFSFPIKSSIQKLIEKCWSNEPSERPNFDEIFNSLTNFNEKSDKNCLLEDVDVDEFKIYIEDINDVKDSTDHLLNRIDELEKENQQLRAENEENEDKIMKLEHENKQLKKKEKKKDNEIQKMKQNEEQMINEIQQLKLDKENLMKEIQKLKSKNQKDEVKSTIKNSEPKIQKEIQNSEDEIKNIVPVQISEFNNLSLKMQESVASNIDKQSVSSIIHYLLKFDELKESAGIVELKCSENSILDEKCEILVKFTAVESLIKNDCFKSTEFIDILKQNDQICFEIKYPSESFDIIYKKFVEFQKSKKFHFEIAIFITKMDDKFKNDQNVDIIILNETVKSIKSDSYQNCTSLKQIIIPSSLTQINNGAFDGCLLLTQIEIPSSLKVIDSCSFRNCSSLKQITIPSSVTKIKYAAFKGCQSLMKITIPSSVTQICDNVFEECSSLEQVIIKSSSTQINNSVFRKCTSLSKINIPSSATVIKGYTFQECLSLSNITIPSSVSSIGNSAFYKCSSITNITIPSSVIEIEPFAFRECSSLKEISIPSSVTKIGSCAFENCSSATKLTISSSVTDIELKTFFGCSSLEEIIIPSSVTSIGNLAFSECTSLINISIPSSVTCIGNSSFCKCSSLKKMSIPSSVTHIGKYAFSGCSSLKKISIPSSVNHIGTYAFLDCSSLTNISIPTSVNVIEYGAFLNCSSLKQVSIPSSFKSSISRLCIKTGVNICYI